MYKKVKESNGGDGVREFVVPFGRGADFPCLCDDDFVGDAVVTLDKLRSENGVALQFVAKFRLCVGYRYRVTGAVDELVLAYIDAVVTHVMQVDGVTICDGMDGFDWNGFYLACGVTGNEKAHRA